VSLKEALAVHDIVLAEYGGLAGIRDSGAIESALARPYCGYYRTIEKKAAALVHSLTLNHGFVDGNKRTAVFMLGILLLGSGYALKFRDAETANIEIENMVLAVAEHRMTFEDIATWLKRYLVKLS
jgi:death on curing protein